MLDYLKYKRLLIIGSVLLVLIGIVLCFFYYNDEQELIQNEISVKTNVTKESISNFYVDVKGAVKDPGVYLVSEGERVIDAITLAGGLKDNASTENINLSQRLVSEMVIVVYTENEISEGSYKSSCDTSCNCEVIEINNCIEENVTSNKININTASLEELMTLSGIGENKAKTIINYREENGRFKSIEEIKNVSGIGESLYESIKDNIII